MFSLQISRTLVRSEFETWLRLSDLRVGLVDRGANKRRFSMPILLTMPAGPYQLPPWHLSLPILLSALGQCLHSMSKC